MICTGLSLKVPFKQFIKAVTQTSLRYAGGISLKVPFKLPIKAVSQTGLHYAGGVIMSNQVEFTNEILIMINNREITPEAGMKMIKNFPLRENGSKEQKKGVAVIGMSGIFPGADNIIDFWNNLVNGKDTVTDFTSRWDKETYYSNEYTDWGKTNIMAGGVLTDIYKFDPEYFNITPLEAQLMDPQQRLFLMAAIKAIEDAGYGTKDFYGTKCGVFVGVRAGDYESLVKTNKKDINSLCMTGNSTSLLPARISYYLNLTGPSIAIDTACSSSLVAISQAAASIINGESETAIAGGVSLYTTPELLIMTSKGKMLSKQGQCRAFDDSADGFVLSEGLGCILLKEVSQAIADKDHIYGIIKGFGINQDGKTNGITSPSAVSQYSLEKEVYQRFSIDPEDISYVETHGTGTKLGDPIEFSALNRSFKEYTNKKKYCALGSVKTNIGHTLAAAGVIGLMKVLLCLDHKKLVPSLHYDTPNSHLALEDSPFYINTRYENWEPVNGKRMAAVSSFGLSGTNCHLVIEGYEAEEGDSLIQKELPGFFPISAKSEQGLRNNLRALKKSLEEYNESNTLSEISQTLIKGRDHFEFRSAIVAASKEELLNGLEQLLKKEICKGSTMSTWEEDKNTLLAKEYVRGETIDFDLLYKENLNKISLYSDGFQYKEVKIPNIDHIVPKGQENSTPLLRKKSSENGSTAFTVTLKTDDFFLKDHLLQGSMVLPGVVYLELVCEAGRALGTEVKNIRDLQWITPVLLESGQKDIEVEAKEKEGKISYQITSLNEQGRKCLHCTCYSLAETPGQAIAQSISVNQIKEFYSTPVNPDEIYDTCIKMGIYHGNSMRTIKEAYAGESGCLSRLYLEAVREPKEYILHPAIMDGILQTVIGITAVREKLKEEPFVPYSIGELNINGPLEKSCFVRFTTGSEKNKFNATVFNENGKVLIVIKDYVIKNYTKGNKTNSNILIDSNLLINKNTGDISNTLKNNNIASYGNIQMNSNTGANNHIESSNQELVYLKEEWLQKPLTASNNNRHMEQVLVFGGDPEFMKQIPGEVTFAAYDNYYEKRDNHTYVINPLIQEDYKKIFEELQSSPLKLTDIIFILPDTTDKYSSFVLPVFGAIRQYFLQREEKGANFTVVATNSSQAPQDIAIYGLLQTAYLENPKLSVNMVVLKGWNQIWKKRLLAEVLYPSPLNALIKYDAEGRRFIRNITVLKGTETGIETGNEAGIEILQENNISIRQKGHYVLTGGTGGLGIIFAKHLIDTYQCRVTLIGRGAREDALQRIRNSGLKEDYVTYYRADTTNLPEMEEAFADIRKNQGGINGILQCVGTIKDRYMIHKTGEELLEVINAKVLSAQVLDAVIKEDKPDFVVYFSAMAAVIGNAGQCDYAYANYYLDEYAKLRNSLAATGERPGHTLSINWPLWDSQGMNIDENTRIYLKNKLGMIKMPAETGGTVLEYALSQKMSQCSVIYGNRLTIEEYFMQNQAKEAGPVSKNIRTDNSLQEITISMLKKIFAKVILKAEEELKEDETFEVMGIDSIIIIGINWELEQIFGSISKTLLFEYNTISTLGEFLTKEYKNILEERSGLLAAQNESETITVDAVTVIPVSSTTGEEEIAIVGLSGRFPEADTLEEFWENLKEGRDNIRIVPKERFEVESYYNEDKDSLGTTYGKWGGFLSEVDLFDPIYFNISPKEAEIMDPQERLFLEEAYKALSDACYTREELKKYKVGVYAGVMYGQYQLFSQKEEKRVIGSSYGSIANRVSYYFDFHGPSIALDTMCSSSLTTIHLACESIKRGECDMALAGGVNLSVHPNKYLLLSQGKFLSTDGKCRSFGDGGNGYVPGEGVGVVVLKSLSKAIADKDNIYGTVKSTAVNHGGRTNGFSVPNPNLQGELVKEAIQKAGIEPESINYLETHGTGTALGDPIEITGLLKNFPFDGKNQDTISIGSVKSNIGHLESAAGVAAIAKALLQMKHKKLVPSLHSKHLNKNINFRETPFKVQQNYEEWKPVVKEDGSKMPRRCGVSSFGAGGSNAFLILEEYDSLSPQKENEPQIIILSGGSKAALKEYIRALREYVRKHAPDKEMSKQEAANELKYEELTLNNIAYSLQKGRNTLTEKAAFTAYDREDFINKLSRYLEGDYTEIHTASTKSQKLTADQEETFKAALLHQDYDSIIKLWLDGAILPWEELHTGGSKRRISLPYVPLNRKRYWYNSYQTPLQSAVKTQENTSPAVPVEQKKAEYPEGSSLSKIYELAGNYSGEEISLEILEGKIALVKMQDFKGRNSFSEEVIAGLIHAFERINRDLNIKAAIVTGYENIFCMGGTKKQLENISNNLSRFSDIPFLYKVFLEARVPVIAAMQGHANGGGMLFGLYADFVIMAEESTYSAVFTKYGFTPGMGGTYIIEKKLGENIATEMMYTARAFSGEELKARGSSVIIKKRTQVLNEALSIARMLAEKPLITIETLKKELSERKLKELDYYIAQEEKMHRETFNKEEVRERINHFYISEEKQETAAAATIVTTATTTTAMKTTAVKTAAVKTGAVKWGLDSLTEGTKAPLTPARVQASEVISVEKTRKDINEQLGAILCRIIHISKEEVNETLSFKDMGMDSINGVEIVRDINKEYGINLDAVALYDYPTIPELAEHIAKEAQTTGLYLLPSKSGYEEEYTIADCSEEVKKELEDSHVFENNPVLEDTPAIFNLAELEQEIREILSEVLHLFTEEVDLDTSFKDMGMDSITSVEIIHRVNKRYPLNLDAVMTYDYPTIRLLAKYLKDRMEELGILPEPELKVSQNIKAVPLKVLKAAVPLKVQAVNDTYTYPQKESITVKTQFAQKEGDFIASDIASGKKSQLVLKRMPAMAENRDHGEKNVKEESKDLEEPEPEHKKNAPASEERMAIVGISGRFPGADSLEEFWSNLAKGEDSITEIPPDRWDCREYYDKNPKTPFKTYSTVGGFLSGADNFDPLFFQISPKEAKAMDPQQRVFLEVAWSALEDAGYTKEQLSGSNCGVFVGAAQGDYREKMKGTDLENSGDAFVGLSPAVLASRIAYILNLKGPCISLDTACSSSLIAIHEACKSIKSGECDMAIAGGIRMMFTPEMHIQTSKMSMLSPTNQIRVFDDNADGTILAEGAGALVIKPYHQAVKDRDYIYGIIRGSGINQDGHTNGITAPSAQSQADLEERVYRLAGVNPEDITYVETHGTGTKLGDPIEFKALKEVFEKYTKKKQFCNIGSVKANIGHATLAAGVISVIKVLLSMRYKQIPPLIHFEKENIHINLADSPFKINTDLTEWKAENNKPRLAAVSAFGFSGTNCHIVLEEAAEDLPDSTLILKGEQGAHVK